MKFIVPGSGDVVLWKGCIFHIVKMCYFFFITPEHQTIKPSIYRIKIIFCAYPFFCGILRIGKIRENCHCKKRVSMHKGIYVNNITTEIGNAKYDLLPLGIGSQIIPPQKIPVVGSNNER